MLGRGIFRKKPDLASELDTESVQAVFDLIDNSTIALSGNALYRLADLDTTDIDECLQHLVADDKLEVAYEKVGLDGIRRPYYRTSEKYKLMDVKDKVSDFMKAVVKHAKPFVANGRSYSVKVPGRKELSMVFDRRQDARDYKRLLSESRLKLRSDITEHEFEDGLQIEERTIS